MPTIPTIIKLGKYTGLDKSGGSHDILWFVGKLIKKYGNYSEFLQGIHLFIQACKHGVSDEQNITIQKCYYKNITKSE